MPNFWTFWLFTSCPPLMILLAIYAVVHLTGTGTPAPLSSVAAPYLQSGARASEGELESQGKAGSFRDDFTAAIQGTHPAWEIRPSAGKGLGVFATTFIRKGSRVLEEEPLFSITPPDSSSRSNNSSSLFRDDPQLVFEEMVRLADAAVGRLADGQRRDFHACHEHRFPGEPARGRNLYILRSNAYTVRGADWGMFPRMARINHSCRPNAVSVWTVTTTAPERDGGGGGGGGGRDGDGDGDTGRQRRRGRGRNVVWAARDIEEGEEVLVSYVPLLQGRAARRRRLEQYGFRCGCGACREEGDAADYRRERMGRLLGDLERAAKEEGGTLDPSTPRDKAEGLLDDAMELIQLLEEADMVGYFARAYSLAARFALRLGQTERAREWAMKELAIHQCADRESDKSISTQRFLKGLDDRYASPGLESV